MDLQALLQQVKIKNPEEEGGEGGPTNVGPPEGGYQGQYLAMSPDASGKDPAAAAAAPVVPTAEQAAVLQQYQQYLYFYQMYQQMQQQQQQQQFWAATLANPGLMGPMGQADPGMGRGGGGPGGRGGRGGRGGGRDAQAHTQGGVPAQNHKGQYTLFVFHLPNSMTEEGMTELFSGCGEVDEVFIAREHKHDITSRSRGYGFVKYKKLSDALNAINTLNGHVMENKRLRVNFKT